MKQRPYILTIAGFDPSSGAGLSADIKTFEALKCYGIAVQTANTIQDDCTFKACHWMPIDVIKAQLELLFERFTIDVVKIGIVENWAVLSEIIDMVLEKNPKAKIILDPVLQSSTNFSFNTMDTQNLIPDTLLPKIYLITPNYLEIEKLYVDKTITETIPYISSKTNLLLKGGHRSTQIGKDELFMTTGQHYILNPKRKGLTAKHGSGCVLSSAIASYIALGFPLLKACYRGKRYTEKVLGSNVGLLGYHR